MVYVLRLLTGLVFFYLMGCTLGPNFQRPVSPHAKTYGVDKIASTLDSHSLIPVKWWRIYQSPGLNQFMDKALKANPDMKAAEANLKIAYENTRVQQAYYLPYLNAGFNPTRQLTAGTLQSNTANNAYMYSLETALVSVSYMPDLWGGQHRRLESLKAQQDSIYFQKKAVYLTLASNIMLAVIQEAALREQRYVTLRMIRLIKKRLSLLKQEQKEGGVGLLPVVSEENLLAQLESTLPALEKQWQTKRHLLYALSGHLPGDHLEMNWTLQSLHLPKKLPLKLPSTLVRQRPDILAAESALHAATADIGVAVANRFPSIILSAYTGSAPLNFGTLFAGGTGFWGAGLNILGPLFDWGALKHKQRAAVAAYEVACAQYRKAVLLAFKNVADTLTAIASDEVALKYALDQRQAAKTTRMIATKSFEYGKVGYLNVLFAEQQDKEAQLNVIQSQANRLSDTVALFQALGGGVWSKNGD
ncbi:MAG: efflux transporter outer membrane subunit [Legionellaceae bacterium]